MPSRNDEGWGGRLRPKRPVGPAERARVRALMEREIPEEVDDDESVTAPGFRRRSEPAFGWPERYARSDVTEPEEYGGPPRRPLGRFADEHAFPHADSPDLYDRTYGTHLGQAIAPHVERRRAPRIRLTALVREVLRRPFRAPRGYRRSDQRIREDVCDALAQLGEIDPSDVEVDVRAGEVILTGTVPVRAWKHAMEDAAAAIPGVADVLNDIRVRHR